MVPFSRAVLAVLGLTLVSLPTVARATQCRAIAGGSPALAGIDAETRLRWLDRRLALDARNARIWSGLWGTAYGGVSVVEASLVATTNDTGKRAEYVVGAVASFIGFAAIVIMPPSIERDQSWWRKHEARAAPGTDPCALLNTAELVLTRAAASEEFGRGPLVHLGNFIINIAAGLVLGLGYDRWAPFAYQSIVGIAVGEVQVITQPIGSINALQEYKAGQLGAEPRARLHFTVVPWAQRDGVGAQLAFAF